MCLGIHYDPHILEAKSLQYCIIMRKASGTSNGDMRLAFNQRYNSTLIRIGTCIDANQRKFEYIVRSVKAQARQP